MPPERALLCHGPAVMTGLLTYLGSLTLHGLATGDLAAALHREALDVGPYWSLGLPACYLVAGVLGYFGPVRTWRWSLDMLATHSGLHADLRRQRPQPLAAGTGPGARPCAARHADRLRRPGPPSPRGAVRGRSLG